MKPIFLLFAAAVVLTACSDPTRPEATRYDLVEYFGNDVPFDATIQLPGEPAPLCQDSLVSGYLELISGSSAARQSFRYVRTCDGDRMVSDNSRTGTYVITADTVRLTWDIDSQPIGTFSEYAILAGNQLRIPYTVYSEADPDGTETSIIYQRR
jgi:hypothetical protein